MDPETLGGSAWEAAFASFLLFCLGAIVPVSPFFFASGPAAVITSLGVSGLALFAVGSGHHPGHREERLALGPAPDRCSAWSPPG